MVKSDKLFEESRIIRKLVSEGKTSQEIMIKMNLTQKQITYRLEAKYTERVAHATLRKLYENNQKNKGSKNERNLDEQKVSGTVLVVDCSALQVKESLKVINSYKTVVVSVETIEEMEKHKHEKSIFGKNIRRFLKMNAKDQDCNKFVVVETEKISEYPDNNIINYCKGKDVILYTGDNGMASKAKAYGIRSIIAEIKICNKKKADKVEVAKNTESIEQTTSDTILDKCDEEVLEIVEKVETSESMEEDNEPIKIDLEELKAAMIATKEEEDVFSGVHKVTIDNVRMIGKDLTLVIPDTTKISYIVLDPNEEIKNPLVENMVKLQKGDTILVITYKHETLCIIWFQIIILANEQHAIYVKSYKSDNIEVIENYDLPQEAKKKIRSYYALVRKK